MGRHLGGSRMAMEYLVALFDRNRRVRINGQFMGRTNRLLELEPGRYEVSLGPPDNFSPQKHDVDLKNTSAMQPLAVRFEVVEDADEEEQ
ncbi:MAG: hypothetical protein ACOCSR_04060 [Wenzhouxiangella sp.]